MFIPSVQTVWWQGFVSIYEVRFSCLTAWHAESARVGCKSSVGCNSAGVTTHSQHKKKKSACSAGYFKIQNPEKSTLEPPELHH